MKLARHRQLDALIGEYILGALRGGARRRFERALREEPTVALRLRTLQREFAPRYSERIAQTPPAGGWERLARELNLSQYRAPWYSRVAFLRGWALGVTAASGARRRVDRVAPGRDDADADRAARDEGCASQRYGRVVARWSHA